jgi:alpha-tubulin suppressor-like RCC1 family protein
MSTSRIRRKEQDDQEQQERNNAQRLGLLPAELGRKIAGYLDPQSAVVLRETCRFFTRNQTLSNIIKSNRKIFASDNCTFILNSRGSLYGMGEIPSYLGGDNTRGCIPIILPHHESITHIAFACMGTTSWAIICTNEGTVYGGGHNRYGQLGLRNQSKPFKLTLIPVDKHIIHATSRGGTTMLLAEDGTVFGCGFNQCGNLGLGDKVNRSKLQVIPLPENTRIKNIVLGKNHTILLSEDGKVYGCGDNHQNQLGFGARNKQLKLTQILVPDDKFIQQIEATDDFTILLATDGTAYICGTSYTDMLRFPGPELGEFLSFKLIPPPDNKPIHAVSGFNYGLLLLARDGTVYGCGNNPNHRFGSITLFNQLSRISILNDDRIKQIATGFSHSIMMTHEGIVYGCGASYSGQLGHIIDTPYISTPTRIDIAELLLQTSEEEKSKLRM